MAGDRERPKTESAHARESRARRSQPARAGRSDVSAEAERAAVVPTRFKGHALIDRAAENLTTDLAARLDEVLPDPAVRQYQVEIITIAALSYRRARGDIHERRARGREWRKHMTAVAKAAERLHGLLQRGHPATLLRVRSDAKMADLIEQEARLVDYDRLRGDLSQTATAAREDAGESPGRGAPPDTWRDSLISYIYSVYPEGAVAKTQGSHFEATVEMVLEFAGCERQDVHGLILDALRRQPSPSLQIDPELAALLPKLPRPAREAAAASSELARDPRVDPRRSR